MVEAPVAQKENRLPDYPGRAHHEGMGVGQGEKVLHPRQLGALKRDLAVVRTRQESGKDRIEAAGSGNDADREPGWSELARPSLGK